MFFFNLRPGLRCRWYSFLAEPVRKDAKAVESYSHNSFISFNSRRLSCRNERENRCCCRFVQIVESKTQAFNIIFSFIRQLYLFSVHLTCDLRRDFYLSLHLSRNNSFFHIHRAARKKQLFCQSFSAIKIFYISASLCCLLFALRY